MRRSIPYLVGLLFFVHGFIGVAQETGAAPTWKITIRQSEAPGFYSLKLKTSLSSGWEVYAPGQILFDQPAASLQFGDSLIQLKKPLQQVGVVKKISSELLGQVVETQTGAIEWNALIQIVGPTPAQIQGTLLFTYGKGEELYPATPFLFIIPIEGGQQQASLKMEKIGRAHV